ncbi:hypothetical protein J2X36_005278 [Methylobacterium sp. BE186]|nr:hypothetical protein [Methylobacterium sp. BE186]
MVSVGSFLVTLASAAIGRSESLNFIGEDFLNRLKPELPTRRK